MKLLHTLDGAFIVVAHVTTASQAMDHEGYRTVSLGQYKLEKDIARAENQPELETALKESMSELYPEGCPRIKDFYRTRVTLSDGSSHWVKESIGDVMRALLDA